MNKNLQSPTKLTEFAPLQTEEKPQSVGQFISKFFKLNKSTTTPEEQIPNPSNNSDNASQESLPTWAIDASSETTYGNGDNISTVYPLDVNEGRSLPNVLKRISNLLALKTNNLQDYADTELKQYWMPDSVSKECYECCEKFTTFRRRHHCRVCGQIFCSQCCNQQIPGKIFGCTGDLRVCTYCCKVVLSYLQSSDVGADLTADLKLLQESLQIKFGTSPLSPSTSIQDNTAPSLSNDSLDVGHIIKRKISVGYQEEKFASGGSANYLTTEEKCKALQNSVSLRNLYDEVCKSNTGVSLGTHRYRLRTYTNCFLGSELVDWLIYQQKANSRVQAAAICQALLEGGYIEPVSEPFSFVDGYALYKPGVLISPEVHNLHSSFDLHAPDEPIWVQQIPQESSTTDSDNEQMSSHNNKNRGQLTSSSSYMLDMNVGANTVYLSRPPTSNYNLQSPSSSESELYEHKDSTVVRTSEQREFVPESGWHNASNLREENGEKMAFNLLVETYQQHEQSLLNQLLSNKGLALSWSDVILPLCHEIINVIRPDKNHDAEDLDIRHYVQFKKLSGGLRSDTNLISGVVCSKNVAHKRMCVEIENPKILLMQCSIVYQRTEGRLMSLEPVLMQEHEYLRHVANRIVALKPDIVLVHRNVSRLAQDLLLAHKITLVHNVKQSVLDRVARCTRADLVSAVDAHIGRPTLGTCKKFYLKKFDTGTGGSKTLMFFEGLPMPHLGGTVLLRGASKTELSRLERVASFFLFATYNWRLEKSFLMDEHAQPPNSKYEFLEDSKENSPTLPISHILIEDKNYTNKKLLTDNKNIEENDDDVFYSKSEKLSRTKDTNEHVESGRKMSKEPVSDFTDPLHSYKSEDNINRIHNNEKFTVSELPFSNNFRKALDDAILSISPYLVFSVPYLETEIGRKCKIRKFFPPEIYYSNQFDSNNKVKPSKLNEEVVMDGGNNNCKVKPLHPFLTAKITSVTDSNDLLTMLAHFRACGGQFEKKGILLNTEKEREDIEEMRLKLKNEIEINKQDVLDPNNHQRLAVLFCSFSHESPNAPAFCVNPWVVYMDFYLRNDIPLGCFLEKYCFRPTYTCPSKTCDTPMIKHIRRFVHNAGCISISLNNFENEFLEESIVMWTWCVKCQCVSPVVPMSSDTWSFSFAKYLELKFHGGHYSRRGNAPCSHSLHHDHYQYFGYKNYVASFKYTSVQIWEISLPPSLIAIKYDVNKSQNHMINEIKEMAQKGHEIYALILEKLASLPAELDGFGNLKQLLLKEQNQFKQKIEEVQIKLTSPTIENREIQNEEALYTACWRISDSLIRIKRFIVETVENWNLRLSEAARKRDNDKKKDKSVVQELESPTSTEGKPSFSDVSTSEHSRNVDVTSSALSSTTKKIKSLDQEEDICRSCSRKCLTSGLFDESALVEASTPVHITFDVNDFNISGSNSYDNECTCIPLSLNSDSDSGLLLMKNDKSKENSDLTIPTKIRKNETFPSSSACESKNILLQKESDLNIPPSPRTHHRSQSDGTVMTHHEDTAVDSKKDPEKKTVKNILQQLLPSAPPLTSIPNPFNFQEHYTLPVGITLPIIVYEDQPSSIIAYSLNSFDYKRSFDELTARKSQSTEQSPSPVHKRRSASDKSAESNDSGLLHILRNRDSKSELSSPALSAALAELSQPNETVNNSEKNEDAKKTKNMHIEVQFEDSSCNFFCRIYFADKFAALRSLVLPIGEEAYIRSLSRSIQWNARGGKSGSNFAKTLDDRFILKEMTKSEVQLFLETAHNYFSYMHRCYTTGQPTLLGKIVGVYQIIFKNNTNATLRTNLLVMENLFYNRTVSQKFDLKGSMRNRFVIPDNQEGEIVLLDENLLKMSCDSPLYILPHSKAVLTAAIQNDTEFLSAQCVMDYSLLVGLDTENNELVLGIIDYIRRFTWDKRLETMVKKSGILGGQGKLPTIISPEEYQKRFIEAMHKYFLEVPDHWAGLGKGLEF